VYADISEMTAEEKSQINKIVKSEQGRLLGFIRLRVKDEMDALDIMQDVFYQLTIGFNDIRSVEKTTVWLLTVAKNRITDYFRKRKPVPLSNLKINQSTETNEEPFMLVDILPALTRSPEDEYMRSIIWNAIQDSLAELPEDQREIFILNEFEDMSFNEISAQKGVGVNTLLSRKRYAVLFLREKLRELYKQL
jgi:RNA polymerase sigma factor (sigma-70 family)